MALPVVQAVQLAAADADGICQSQTPAGAGDLTINGALASGGVATLTSAGAARQVIVTSAADETGKTFTIYGTGPTGVSITDSFAGANAGVATSAKYFRTVTRVAISAAAAGAVTVGTNGVGVSRWITLDTFATTFNVSNSVVVSGTVNYTLQYTYDKLDAITTAWDDALLTAETANGQAFFSNPCTAARLLINSGTGSATLTVIQTGVSGP